MTPEEKAQELFNEYLPLFESYTETIRKLCAKECVIICVNEIVLHCNQYEWEYWDLVKKELNYLTYGDNK
jgi:hypothetical protein